MVELYPETERFQQHRWLLNKSPAGAELSLSAASTFISDNQFGLEGNQSKANQAFGRARSIGRVCVTGIARYERLS